MVIVDTSVWVENLRTGNDQLEELLIEAEVICHEFIIGELACGNLRNRGEILGLLKALPVSPTVGHLEFLHFIDEQQLMGRGIGFVDVHLLASAQLSGVPIWTVDRKLAEISKALSLQYTGS